MQFHKTAFLAHRSFFCAFALAAIIFFTAPPLMSAELDIRNLSHLEILNIQINPGGQKKPIFLRLDLLPGANDKFINPEISGTLRADTGLEMLYFPKLDLRNIIRLSFCQEHPACLVTENKQGKLQHLPAKVKSLLPGPGSRPVCQLDQFRPQMPMKEVCALLDPDTPTDDNGAWITGLGFANLLWAARLIPVLDNGDKSTAKLEHLELRRPLSSAECRDILKTLFEKGYLPWQAEFPGLDINFQELPGNDISARQKLLWQSIDDFLNANKKENRAPQINNVTDEEAEARILLAPAKNMAEITNADDPSNDVQIITMILKPLSSTLLLDVTAYMGKNK